MSSPTTKPRDYLFDNCKAFLILMVVLGHFTEGSYQHTDFLYTLKWLIVSFHMPAFIFISGYFSKRELSLSALIWKLGVPYLVYEVVYYLLYTLVLHRPTSLALMFPKFSLWYILALFVWRLVTPYVKKIPHHFLLSIAAGLLIGCVDGMPSNFLSIPRILVFYPFFLAGMYCDRSWITRLRTRVSRLVSLAGIAAFIIFLVLEPRHKELSVKIFYGRYSYEFLGQDPIAGILCRIICYAVGAFMTFAILMLMTERQTAFSYIGTRTMAIYIFHGLVYSCLRRGTPLLDHIDTLAGSLLLIAFCILLTGVLSLPQFTTVTNKIASLRLPERPILRRPEAFPFPRPENRVFIWKSTYYPR